jgi:hypothetical protein
MNDFLFRFPADTPEMTFNTLAARLRAVCNRDRCTSCIAKIGSTVTLRWHVRDKSAIQVQLYEVTIAILTGDGTIRFPNDDPHYSTTYWIERIVSDNGLGHRAGRIRRHAADGPGPETGRGGRAGLLAIDFDRDKPVHGRVWTAVREGVS